MERAALDLLGEEDLQDLVDQLVRIVEAGGALVIFAGVVVAFVRLLAVAVRMRGAEAFTPVRLDLARFLALGLEFQLASDLLRTTVAPTFDEIGKLAAVAAIRTALNYFLGREIEAERLEVEGIRARSSSAGPPPP